MGFKFVPANANILYGATVSGTGPAADFQLDWLCDGRNRPAWFSAGTVSLSAAGSGDFDTVVLHSHTVDAGATITVTGGSISALPYGGLVAFDPWIEVSPGSNTVALAISGNSRDLVLGELFAGERIELARDIPRGSLSFGYIDKAIRRKSQRGSVPNYPRGIEQRWMKGSLIVSAEERDIIQSWYQSTREDSRPSVIQPVHDVADAWLVGWSAPPSFALHDGEIDGKAAWLATLEFEEWERNRWIS